MKSGLRNSNRSSGHDEGIRKGSLEAFKTMLKDDRVDEGFSDFRKLHSENVVERSGSAGWGWRNFLKDLGVSEKFS